MNANDFFEKYSIEEINKKTKISPISLRYIKNREFDKIQRVKFLGFIKIIENEYKVDLSELVNEYNQKTEFKTQQNNEIILKEPKKHNTLIIFILAIILFGLGSYILYTNYFKRIKAKEINQTAFLPALEINSTNNTKNTEENNKSIIITASLENNITKETNTSKTKKVILPTHITIIPNSKVWYRAKNLDTNKTIEYLTSKIKELNGTNWYIKFGHGDIQIEYGDKNITPNTKKVIRILLKDGNYTYLKRNNRFEK